MNKAQKEVQLGLLKSEEECIAALEKAYRAALKDINAQIRQYQGDDLTQSQIYQRQYQEALKAQVETILDKMNADQYGTIQGYLSGCYQDSFAGVMYDLRSQGIPVTVPIQQDQVVKAVTTDSKLSKPMYEAMGKYLKPLKKRVAAELSRGFASGLHYYDIARNIEQAAHIGLYNAQRIARTEGHRIQCAAALDAQKAAKEAGADVVKQWDSTMDGRTRKDHRKLDGQIREIDEPFEVGGHKAMAPGQFGRPEEDIHCRCAILQRAKWALDDDELKALEDKAAFWGLDKSEDFESFKKSYGEESKKQARIAELSKQLAKDQKKLDKMQKVYSGIWKDDVTLADYDDKKGSVAAKRSYYEQQMAKMDPSDPKYAQFGEYLRALDEFERLGPKYREAEEALRRLREELGGLMPKPEPGDAYTKARKDAAYWFTSRNGGTKGADKVLRKKCSEVWRKATKAERDAIYGYTSGSGAWNRPLAGFQKPYAKPGSGWEPKYFKGAKRVWLDYEGHGDAIRRMTDLIEKSSYDFDMWVQRGVDYNAVEQLLGLDFGKLSSMSGSALQKLVGTEARMMNFQSCGVSKGKGFSHKPVILNIYAPEGTHMMYAEPFSAYGAGDGHSWDGKSAQSYFGDEAEVIIQRGGSYTVTKIEESGGRLYIDLEHHPEDGYDLFQQDPGEWTGSKSQYR